MVASLVTPADVVNVALSRIGYKLSIGSLYDGSEAAGQALSIYAHTRDELLRQNDWDFAERNLSLTLLKQAPDGGYVPPTVWTPAYPPIPWFFQYAYPDDCLKVRAIKPQSIFVMEFDPQPVVWSIANDPTYSPIQRVILCNVPDAIMTYTGQVTNITNWDVDTVEAFAATLGRRLVPTLMGLKALQPIAADEAQAVGAAEREQG